MMCNLTNRVVALMAIAASLLAGQSYGQIAQWNFNGTSTTTVPGGTGAPTVSLGTGTASLFGGATATFASGAATGGSTDPVTTSPPNFGWNVSTFDAQGVSTPRGVRFNVSTVGFQNIQLRFDLRFSNTSSRWVRVQYTLNGTTFSDYTGTFTDSMNLYRTLSGDAWKNNIRADFSSIPGANNNPTFGVRIIPAFAPGGTTYAPAQSTSSYLVTGTWRFDMVTISGMALPPPPSITFSNPVSTCDSTKKSGYIIATLNNGFPPYTFKWNNSIIRPKLSQNVDTLFVQSNDTVRLEVMFDTASSLSGSFVPTNVFIHPAAPSLLSVLGVSDTSATFTWSSCDDELVTGYQLWLAGGIGVINLTKVNSFAISNLTPGTSYSWSVRARYPLNPQASAWSNGFSFSTNGFDPCQIGQPTGLSTTGITNTAATISWSAMPGANRYRVWVTGRSTQIISGTSLALTGLAAGTNYNWTVTGICASGSLSEPSASSFLTTGASACVAPTNFGSSYVNPTSTFTWDPVPANLPRYQIWIQGVGVVNTLLTTPTFATNAIPNGVTASWTVRTLCAGRVTSAWASPNNSFTAARQGEMAREDRMSPEDIERADRMLVNNQASMQIQVYPNPAQSTIMIQSSEPNTHIETVKIVDMKGSLMLEMNAVERDILQLNIEHLPHGMYTVHVLTQGQSITQKLIRE